MRRTGSALLALVLAVAGGAAVASADPEASAPSASPYALITVTTIPNGWQERTDLRPILEVYSDGHAVERPDVVAADRRADVAPQQVDGTIRAEVLHSALAEIKELAAVDFGTPATNDHGVEIIDLMPQPPDQDAHLIVYSPDQLDGFGADQQSVRKRFADLYRALLDGFVKN